MIKNYFYLNSGLNLRKAIALFFVFFISSHASNAQCATPVSGCSNTDLSNFGAASNNNAATIEYDNFVSSWHTTVVRTSDGSFQTWGEAISNTGTNVLSPLTINRTNFPALSVGAVPLKVALGSSSSSNVQGILLATDGLYAWSKVGMVLDASLTGNATFQKLAIGGNANGLPAGVNPGDVKMMFATYRTLAITTCSGDVWVISQTAAVRGNGASGNATSWYKVRTSEAGNPYLTDVVACRGNNDGLMALKSDGTVYVWGVGVFLGNNTAAANQNYAAPMALPSGITPKMIGSTGNGTARSHYILATDGNLYALGTNANGQLGDWTVSQRLSWIQPRYNSTSGPVMNDIKWFSPQEHDAQYAAVNVLTASNKIFAFGNSNGSLLGLGSGAINNPASPGGLTGSDNILAVETGGHTSMLVKSCETKFGYVGHRISGSMGDGTNNTTNETSYTFATANVQICGAESNPAIQPISTGGGPDSKYCVDDPVLLNPTPAGGTLSILSGPGTLSGNTLSFTGEGTVSVQYSVTTACGGTSVTTRSFDAALCPADLQITKVADNAVASVGSNVVFTITAKNNGPYKATGVTVNDALPSGYTFVSAAPSVGTWSAPNWTIGSLANGASASLAVTATVNATGSYANTASITGNNPDNTAGNNSATATPLVQSNLSVVKSINNMSPNVGSNVTFTITASNAGPSKATGVKVIDNLPSGYTFVSASASSGSWSAPEWNIGNLASGATSTLTVVATVNAGGSYTNTAAISGLENDPVSGNNSSSVTPTVNHNPTAVADIYTVSEDNSVTLTPLANDSDADGDTITIASINGTALTGSAQTIAVPNGTVNISAAGVITFTPDANFNSATAISFPYAIGDGHGGTATANINITVTAVNDAPTAVNDSYTVAEDNTVTLTPLSNDSDADGDTITIASINGTALTGSAQTISVPNGTVNISAAGAITFTPDANFNSATAISFPYVIGDGHGGTATANISITVTAVNDAPTAVNDSYTVAEDNTVTLTPLTNDSDVDGDTITIASINGTALTGSAQSITVPNGTVNISASGVITFTPDANFNSAAPVSIPYVITDGSLTATANISITVTAVNDAPTAVNDSYTVAEDNTVTLSPLTNDSDLDGDTVTITSINGTALTGSAQTIAVPNGTVNISAAGVITFTPAANFNSATAISFPYVIGDGHGGTATANISITVTAVNDAPTAVNDSYTVAEDNTATLAPLSNDSDVDGDTMTIASINGTALTGSAQTIAVPNGTVNISAAGVITFTPDANFNSATAISFPYVIGDGHGGTATANINIIVTAVNDAPTAVNDSYTVAEDNTVTLAPLTNDSDVDGDTITIASINGTALTGSAQTIAVPNGTVNISAAGAITFTPAANFNSATAISFPYVIGDGHGGTATANISITVTAVNDAPTAVNDSYTVAEDNTVTLSPLNNDSDVDGDTITIASINGTALTGSAQTIAVPNGTVNISASGVITFTPDTNFNSTAPVSIPYVITDGSLTATSNISITVTAVNDAPTAVNDSYTVAEDNTVTLAPLSNDSDVDGDTVTIASINGTALTGSAQSITVPSGTVNISAAGVITFTPDTNFNSAAPVSIPYVITDGSLTATANINITVTAVNDAPTAVNDSYAVAEDNTVTLTPLNNDSDVDGDTITIASINGTALTGSAQTIAVPNGTVNISAAGVITFTPAANFNSATAISFPYVIGDGHGGTATANINITVTAVNDAPVANNDTNGIIPSTANATAINALTATDVDGTIANYTIVTLPTQGTLALNGTAVTANQTLTPAEAGQLTYDPSGSFIGNDSFTFKATDDLGLDSAPATITIVVGNNAPTANDDTNNGIPSSAGATVINALTAADTDGTVVNYIVLTLPSHGILALAGNPIVVNQILTPTEAGMLTYDPSGAFSGNDSFTFTATDNNGAVDASPATITIPVIKRNLVATKDEIGSVVGINEVVKVINVLNNDTLDKTPLVISDVNLNVVTPDPNNVLTLKPDGTVELIPNAPAGTYTLTYEICEKANPGNCTSATVTVTVVAPTMTIKAESYCSNNAAYVSYTITPDNFTPTGLLTINWIDSANKVVATQTNMPLNGNILWPGMVLDANNRPTDWPGWVLTNGEWLEGADGFELTRPAVTIQFTLNPTQSVTVNYPAATSGCNAKPQYGIEAGNDDDIARADGINGSLEIINVLDNDKLNGVPVRPEDVILTGNNFPAGITLNGDGTIDVAPGTKGGSHTLTYQICEKANGNNCSTATVHIFVEVPAVSLVMKVTSDDSNKNGAIEAGETLNYTFTVTNTGNVDLKNITISDLLPGIILHGGPINLAVGASDSTTFTATYTLTQADINAGMVSNQSTVTAASHSGITVDDKSDAENVAGDNPTVIEFNGCDIKIFNAVSLNGDSMNERFYIRGIECYPDNTVQIFNRWGVLVFERDHYNNNDVVFKGYSEGRTTVKESNGLPEGTYYYILRYKDNQSKPQQKAGYLYLTK